MDENINPGKYGFRLIHDTKKTHFFSSDEQFTIREWMKALMKATIGRDYTSGSTFVQARICHAELLGASHVL